MAAKPAYSKKDERYQDSPKQVKIREARNRARAEMEREGKVHKGDGMDVDHIHPLSKGGSTLEKNLRVITEHQNRAFKRFHHAWAGPVPRKKGD